MVPEGAMKMKHIRVERCCDCPYCGDFLDNHGDWIRSFCRYGKDYVSLDDTLIIHHDCPLPEDHTEALMAALELLLKKPKTLAEMRYPSECEYANAEALAVLDAAKSARKE